MNFAFRAGGDLVAAIRKCAMPAFNNGGKTIEAPNNKKAGNLPAFST
jgi:hypothetical protein